MTPSLFVCGYCGYCGSNTPRTVSTRFFTSYHVISLYHMDWIVSEGAEAELHQWHGPLVGAPGADFVAQTLGRADPVVAIREIHARGGIRDPR